MKGTDGIAMRESVYVDTALDDVVVLAAPGAGYQICAFAMLGSIASTALVILRDDVPVNYWGMRVQYYGPFEYADECGLFAVADNRPLILENPSLVIVTLNMTYEIRPTGM